MSKGKSISAANVQIPSRVNLKGVPQGLDRSTVDFRLTQEEALKLARNLMVCAVQPIVSRRKDQQIDDPDYKNEFEGVVVLSFNLQRKSMSILRI